MLPHCLGIETEGHRMSALVRLRDIVAEHVQPKQVLGSGGTRYLKSLLQPSSIPCCTTFSGIGTTLIGIGTSKR